MSIKSKIMMIGGHIWCRALPPALDLHKTRLVVPKEVYTHIVDTILPGDILLSKSSGFAGNLFIPGKFKHAAIYTGISMNEVYSNAIIHAIQPQVVIEELWGFLAQSDEVQVWRSYPQIPHDYLDIVCKRAKNTINKNTQYDFDYLSDANRSAIPADDRLYCSELIAFSYRPYLISPYKFAVSNVYGKDMYLPNEFVSQGSGWKLIAEYR